MFSELVALTALVPPLLAAGIVVLRSNAGEQIAKIGITALAVSTSAAILTLIHTTEHQPLLLKFTITPDALSPTILVDRLAAVMMVLISAVSLVIHAYSRRYMQGDQGYVKFFALLSLLTFVLLALVVSANLLWLFIWCHLVSWLLWALLAFNHRAAAARLAARTILRIQTLVDATLLIAILIAYVMFGTLDLTELFQRVADAGGGPIVWAGTPWETDAVTLMTLVLIVTIMTKSAQFPFHVWLPGTIEAPTPVSAMLHAGIVNAGGFLVNRFAPLYGMAPATLHVLFIVGGLTALIGASTMLTQPSIKRTLVYSTMGQMGYMIMECGLGAFALAIFHLCAHGLFKATLFLNSGSVIHHARLDFKLPGHSHTRPTTAFSLMTWATGLVITLLLPLVILLLAHGLVRIPLFEAQGMVIFLFFAWVTSAQAIFSLYRLEAVASWKVSIAMLVALAVIGLTYLWAGEAFTGFLYSPPETAAYFQAAAWPKGLFDLFVVISAILVVAVWIILYARAHGLRVFLPDWVGAIYGRLYVSFLSALYIEDLLRAIAACRTRRPRTLPRQIGELR
ncbi:MAG TPA: proton-conducting transporter membrane subunit [Nitrospiraceae bacterium]|nr:proton-conducting transporter membrane subunit [Nitrospiraceae bacterium]